jgi:pSer/pThr/pTyr-binding forkhead associated (FHA) protein
VLFADCMTVETPADLDPSRAHEQTRDTGTEALAAIEREEGRSLCTRTLPTPSEPGRYLEIRSHSEATLLPIERDILHIGRSLASDVRLEDVSVSRRHAILVSRGPHMRVLDDRSSNGVFLNGRRVTEADLSDGDVLALGRIVIRYLEV